MDLVTPVGRLVQGSISLETKMDPQTNKPKLDENGQQVKEMFIAVAFSKTDPNVAPLFNKLYADIVACARAEFGHLFNAQGQMTHPGFAWKIQDGDGVDTNGKSVADKPGWAGHWILKMQTQYLPKCFHYGKYDSTQQITNPTEVIKRGYYIRVGINVRGNGVKATENNKKPGMFISPNLIELCGFGEEIQGGPDASKVFGGAGAIALPAGASTAPVIPAPGAPGLAPPPAPGAPGALPPMPGAAGVPALPAMPAAPPPPPPAAPMAPPPPPPPAGPVLTAKAQGVSYAAMIAQGWTDATLREHGYLV